MDKYSYLNFMDLFYIEEVDGSREKGLKQWGDSYGFVVSKKGVWAIPQDEKKINSLSSYLSTNEEHQDEETTFLDFDPDLFSKEELHGQSTPTKIHQKPKLRIHRRTSTPPQFTPRLIPEPKRLPPSEESLEKIKEAIEKQDQTLILPPSPPMLPEWAEKCDPEEPLLTFPCTGEQLRDFVLMTNLTAMLPPDHELLREPPSKQNFDQPNHSTQIAKTQGKHPAEDHPSLYEIGHEKLCSELDVGPNSYNSVKYWVSKYNKEARSQGADEIEITHEPNGQKRPRILKSDLKQLKYYKKYKKIVP